MAKYLKLKRFQGSTLGYRVLFTKNGIGINITNYKVYFTLKENKEDSDANAKINKVITTHTDAINGKSLIEFIVADTKELSGNYFFSIDYKNTEDDTGDVLFYGKMTIEKTTRVERE